jgi:hypothetical protein
LRPDKEPQIHKWHHYFDIYERAFVPLRDRAVRLLEIGVQRGGSLRMWQEWFAPGAQIFGLDIDPACRTAAAPGIEVFIGDASDRAFLADLAGRIGPLDVVIDDGGHTARQQINAFLELYPRMTEDGVYLIEDTHTALWGGEFADTEDGSTIFDFAFRQAYRLMDWYRNREHFGRYGMPPEEREGTVPVSEFCRTTRSVQFYDSVIVFERGSRGEPWHEIR